MSIENHRDPDDDRPRAPLWGACALMAAAVVAAVLGLALSA